MSELVEAVAKVMCATADENFDIRFDYAAAPGYARAAIEAVFSWLEKPSEAVWESAYQVHDAGPGPVWTAVLAKMKKEALE